MANIKISELEEATSISNNDLLVIVDVENNETKKVKAQYVGGNIPIQSEAPENPETDDLWIDTNETSKLKYFDGSKWNIVNGQITGDTLPIGSIMPYGGATTPTGWLICNGQEVNRTSYSELFSAIGTNYGEGNGSTTFNIPDLRGKVSVGKGTDEEFNSLGKTGGEKTHTLTINEMPQHSHGIKVGYTGSGSANVYYTNNSGDGNLASNNAGGGQAHNNLQPYLVTNYIIKVKQIAGVVGKVENTWQNSTNDTYSCSYINGIVESVSNEIGSYTKYIDGTLICKGYINNVTTNAGSGNNVSIGLPTSFTNGDYVVNTTILNGQAYWGNVQTSVSERNTNNFKFTTWNSGSGANTNQSFMYTAIGKWK